MFTTLFADDACLSSSHSSINKLEATVNQELTIVNKWMQANRLKPNVKKTNYMLIHKKRNTFPLFTVLLNKCQISRKTQIKYLGIILDQKLDWKPQINNVKNKLSKCLWAIFKIRPFVDTNTLKLLYYALAYSHLQYGITFWGAANKSALLPVITKQKFLVRAILFESYRTSSSPLFLELQLLNVNQIYKLKIGTLMHKTLNSSIVTPYKLTKTTDIHSYNTRSNNKNNFYLPNAKTNLSKQSLAYNCPSIWNNIPPEIRSLPFSLFKKHYKLHLLSFTT